MELNLWLSLSAKNCWNPCWRPYMCTRIWVRTMIGLFKMSLSICQSGQKEIQNVVPIIVWVQYWPRTRISVLLCRRCLLGLDYICSTHYTQQEKCWNTVMRRCTFSEKNLDSLPTLPPPHQICLFFVVSYRPFSVPNARPWDKGGHSFSPLEKGGLVSKHFFSNWKRYSQEDFWRDWANNVK